MLGGPMNPMLPLFDNLNEAIACLVSPKLLKIYTYDPF